MNKRTDLIAFLMLGIIIILLIILNQVQSNKNECEIVVPEFVSQNLSVSDMGRLYFECIKYCEHNLPSYDAKNDCYDACRELKNFVE